MNTYKVTLTLEVEASSVEEAKAFFIQDVNELQTKAGMFVTQIDGEKAEALNTPEEIKQFLNGNNTYTIADYIVSLNDLPFEMNIIGANPSRIEFYRGISKQGRRKYLIETIEQMPNEDLEELFIGRLALE